VTKEGKDLPLESHCIVSSLLMCDIVKLAVPDRSSNITDEQIPNLIGILMKGKSPEEISQDPNSVSTIVNILKEKLKSNLSRMPNFYPFELNHHQPQ
jgi:hypothetical protein